MQELKQFLSKNQVALETKALWSPASTHWSFLQPTLQARELLKPRWQHLRQAQAEIMY